MKTGKEKTITIIAIAVLLIGLSSTVYVHASTINKESIKILEDEYTIDQLFLMIENRDIETDEGVKTGIALDDMILKLGVNCPTCHSYTFKAKDGYQQTVDWVNMQEGVLTEQGRVFFANTAHAIWVRDVIEIEVK